MKAIVVADQAAGTGMRLAERLPPQAAINVVVVEGPCIGIRPD